MRGSTSTPSFIYVRGASGMVKMKRSPAFRPAREPGAMANTMVWLSDVRTFTRCDAGSTAVMIARTVPSASLPLMSAADWEGTRTVTVFPFQSRVWYVVVATFNRHNRGAGMVSSRADGADDHQRHP